MTFILVMLGLTIGIIVGLMSSKNISKRKLREAYNRGHKAATDQDVEVFNSFIRRHKLNINSMKQQQSKLSSLDNELKTLIMKFHPDRNPRGLDANYVTAHISALRTKYKE